MPRFPSPTISLGRTESSRHASTPAPPPAVHTQNFQAPAEVPEALQAFFSTLKRPIPGASDIFIEHGFTHDVTLDWLAANSRVPEVQRLKDDIIERINVAALVHVHYGSLT